MVRIQAHRLHVTEPFTGTQQYNKRAERKKKNKKTKKNILGPLTLLYFQEVLLVCVVR